MAAKINNFPSYVVYDQSYAQIPSVSGPARAAVIHGSYYDIIDKDTDTYFQYRKIGDALNGDYDLILDYGKILWNCQVSIKCWINADQKTIDASNDGATWTNIISDPMFVGDDPTAFDFILMQFRYLRFRGHKTSGANGNVKVYECRVMGS